MVNSAQKIDKSIQKMMTLGRRLGILFTALFIAVCCCSVVVVISIGLMAAQGNLYDPSKTVSRSGSFDVSSDFRRGHMDPAGNQHGHGSWRIALYPFACSKNLDYRVAVCCSSNR